MPNVFSDHPTPHRGGLVLVLGILGLVVCFVLGIFAWSMGNADLKAMQEGRMDPSGRDLTQAGKVCGMVGVIIQLIALLMMLLMMLVQLPR
jgi:hypothetical protein